MTLSQNVMDQQLLIALTSSVPLALTSAVFMRQTVLFFEPVPVLQRCHLLCAVVDQSKMKKENAKYRLPAIHKYWQCAQHAGVNQCQW